jgi:hypothetical protein
MKKRKDQETVYYAREHIDDETLHPYTALARELVERNRPWPQEVWEREVMEAAAEVDRRGLPHEIIYDEKFERFWRWFVRKSAKESLLRKMATGPVRRSELFREEQIELDRLRARARAKAPGRRSAAAARAEQGRKIQ